MEVGPDVMGFRTDEPELNAGREILAKTHVVQDGRRWREVWRLTAYERKRERGREL